MPVSIDPEQVRSVAGQVSAAAGEIEAQLASLRAQIGSVADFWTGAGASALEQIYAQWDTQASAVHETLTQISTQMVTSADNYESTDAAAAAAFTPQ